MFHVDFFNGQEDGVLQNIIDNCPKDGYNSPCNCAEDFLTENSTPSGAISDDDVKRCIVDEPTDVIVGALSRGTYQGSDIITKC